MPSFTKIFPILLLGCLSAALWQTLVPPNQEPRQGLVHQDPGDFRKKRTPSTITSQRDAVLDRPLVKRSSNRDLGDSQHLPVTDLQTPAAKAAYPAISVSPSRHASTRHHRSRSPVSGEKENSATASTFFPADTTHAVVRRTAIAAALLRDLEPEQLAALGAHEEVAVRELGQYAIEAEDSLPTDETLTGGSPELLAGDTPTHNASASSESDAFLRATLGFTRYNQLSFLAAARAAEDRRSSAP